MRVVLVLAAFAGLAACGGSETPSASDASPAAAATAAPSEVSSAEPESAVITQELAYGATDFSNLIGYLAMPEDVIEPLPGIVVVHEWWGLEDETRALSRRLAAEGYVVLAVDLFDGDRAGNTAEAEVLRGRTFSEPEAVLANVRQARDYLASFALAPRIALLGSAMGGGWALRAGLDLGSDVDAVVVYYGPVLIDPDALTHLEAPLLAHYAEHDETVRLRDVQTFRTALKDLGKSADVFVYSGVGHAFANPSATSYDAPTAGEAWAKTLAFLDANLLIGAKLD